MFGGPFDAVLMHTLLSHVTDPAEVLLQAHRLAAPDALLVIMDGDYALPPRLTSGYIIRSRTICIQIHTQ